MGLEFLNKSENQTDTWLNRRGIVIILLCLSFNNNIANTLYEKIISTHMNKGILPIDKKILLQERFLSL